MGLKDWLKSIVPKHSPSPAVEPFTEEEEKPCHSVIYLKDSQGVFALLPDRLGSYGGLPLLNPTYCSLFHLEPERGEPLVENAASPVQVAYTSDGPAEPEEYAGLEDALAERFDLDTLDLSDFNPGVFYAIRKETAEAINRKRKA